MTITEQFEYCSKSKIFRVGKGDLPPYIQIFIIKQTVELQRIMCSIVAMKMSNISESHIIVFCFRDSINFQLMLKVFETAHLVDWNFVARGVYL